MSSTSMSVTSEIRKEVVKLSAADLAFFHLLRFIEAFDDLVCLTPGCQFCQLKFEPMYHVAFCAKLRLWPHLET